MRVKRLHVTVLMYMPVVISIVTRVLFRELSVVNFSEFVATKNNFNRFMVITNCIKII